MEKSHACFWAAGFFFVLFVADILISKVQILSNVTSPVYLGDTLQFLVLLVAVALFVAGTLFREQQEKQDKGTDIPAGG